MSATDDHPNPPSLCPACRYAMDRASAVDGDHKPSEGDLSLCFGCGAALQFDATLRHRLLTLSDLQALAREDPDMLRQLEAARREIMRLRAEFRTRETTEGRA